MDESADVRHGQKMILEKKKGNVPKSMKGAGGDIEAVSFRRGEETLGFNFRVAELKTEA
jgi:hypothetical protein